MSYPQNCIELMDLFLKGKNEMFITEKQLKWLNGLIQKAEEANRTIKESSYFGYIRENKRGLIEITKDENGKLTNYSLHVLSVNNKSAKLKKQTIQ